jgi:hypothetical protein
MSSNITSIKFQTISSLILCHGLRKTKEIFIIIIIFTEISTEFRLKTQFP